MTGIRLLALDMDGTTLTSDKTITRETEKWIQKARDIGVTVSFATGRGIKAIEFAEQLQLSSPHVLLNGSLVLDANGAIIEKHFLDAALMEPLYQLAVNHDTWCWGFTDENGRRTREGWKSEWLKESWFKFGYFSNDKSIIDAIREELSLRSDVEVTSSDWNNLEVNPKGVTKASGIKSVCQLLGIHIKDVMAIGDSLNDYPLFKEAGLSIAMDNAHPKLKEIASGITRSNDEEGVAHAIQTHLFKTNGF